MRDQIEIVETDREAVKLRWTCIGIIDYEDGWQNTASVWCKAGKYVILADRGNGACEFAEYITNIDALTRIYKAGWWQAVLKNKEEEVSQ